jgi:molybdenum cofactor biosynthesis enzyme MoaA
VKSERIQKQGNAGIHIVSTMRHDLAKIIVNVHSSRNFERAETDISIAANGYYIDYAASRLSK